MSDYRWNTNEAARDYDAAAEQIHPYYREVQWAVARQLAPLASEPAVVVDLGGGSGRLMARILEQFPQASGVVVDQSEAFLALAAERLAPFDQRTTLVCEPLQHDWPARLSQPASAIVSTSAIHHLTSGEKQALFGRCHQALAAGGILINGDEYRPQADEEYLGMLEDWSLHMSSALRDGRIPESFAAIIDKWRARNIGGFGGPRTSGDDCHETLATQCEYLRAARFSEVKTVWQRKLWAVLVARKSD